MKKYNIGVKFVQSEDPKDFIAAIDDKTKAIYCETIGNPYHIVADVPTLSKVSRSSADLPPPSADGVTGRT